MNKPKFFDYCLLIIVGIVMFFPRALARVGVVMFGASVTCIFYGYSLIPYFYYIAVGSFVWTIIWYWVHRRINRWPTPEELRRQAERIKEELAKEDAERYSKLDNSK